LTSWTKGPSLLQKRDHHATFVADSSAGAFLYVLGGIQDNTNELATVEFAPLGADGSVGAWAAGADLPEVMAGHMIATVGTTLMVSGGYRTGPVLSPKTEVTTIQADGTLGPWKEGPKMKAGRFHHAMVAWKDSFYVVGGLTGDNTDSTPKVERAIVAADGTVGAWTPMTPLPVQRSHHSLAAYEGALYLTAGLTGDPAGVHTDLKDVLRAPILDDGTIGAWATVGTLPATLGTHASFAHLGYLYVLGGVENNAADTAHVRRAPIGKDGMLGAWEDLAPLPKARAHDHHTPYHAGFVYAAGGAVNHVSVNDVFVGHFE
jgi:N-acetylneuraminic acid mutarotase